MTTAASSPARRDLAAWLDGLWGRRAEARILDVLRAHPEGLSEHRLLELLPASDGRSMWDLACEGDLELFRVHFMLFHLLYRLRDRLRADGDGDLAIHVLAISFLDGKGGVAVPSEGDEASSGLAEHDGLRAYYLDLEGAEGTSAEEVRSLLATFWERLAGLEGRDEALARLGLSDPVDRATVERRYRELAMRHHPDRGGDGQRLVEITEAMALLRRGSS